MGISHNLDWRDKRKKLARTGGSINFPAEKDSNLLADLQKMWENPYRGREPYNEFI